MPDVSTPTRVCRHYRTKAMFSRASGRDRLTVNEETIHFPFCWCARSTTDLGPDDALASPQNCSNPGRHCFQR